MSCKLIYLNMEESLVKANFRVILQRDGDPVNYTNFMKLESHFQIWKAEENFDENHQPIVDFLLNGKEKVTLLSPLWVYLLLFDLFFIHLRTSFNA